MGSITWPTQLDLLLGVCLAIFTSIVLEIIANKIKIKIKIKTHIWDWLLPVGFIYIMLIIAFIFDLDLSSSIRNYIDLENSSNLCKLVLKCIILAVENGVLIAILSAVLSWWFGKFSRVMWLDLNPQYSENTAKDFFSVAIISICFSLSVYIYLSGVKIDNPIFDIVAGKILSWGAIVLGIWFYIGIGCKGRKEEYQKNVEVSNYKGSPAIEIIKFEWPMYVIVLLLSVCMVLYRCMPQKIELIENVCSGVGIVYFFACSIIAIIINKIKYPSYSMSEKILAKAIKDCSGKKKRFQRLEYCVEKLESETKLRVTVYKVDIEGVIAPELFESKTKEIDKDEYKDSCILDDILEFLKTLNDVREDNVKNSWKKCKEERIKQLTH